jgi:hypothetical protein
MGSHAMSPINSSNGCVNWTDLLNRTRQLLLLNTRREEAAMELTRPQFARLGLVLQEYVHLLAYSLSPSNDDKRRLLLDTRAALRIGLCCSSVESDQVRDQVLTEAVAVQSWHKPLARIVSSLKGDPKTRVLASQLLSNLLTNHAPSAKVITSFLATTRTIPDNPTSVRRVLPPNWVDMMLACVHTNNRPALAATVAAMHNAIVSFQKHDATTSSDKRTLAYRYVHALAADQMVMNTLLRQIVSVQSVKDMIRDNNNNTAEEAQDASASPGDSATEWISLLLIKCCQCGHLPTMFAAMSSQSEQPLDIAVFPEHLVLLQCIHSQVDTPGETPKVPLLGGEAGSQGVISTHLFLAKLYGSLRRLSFHLPMEHSPASSPDWSLNAHAMTTILETLASSLGQDGDFITLARCQLGQEDACTLIPDAGIHLGAVLDDITRRNHGRKSRDFIMFDNEKQLVTALVQLLAQGFLRCLALIKVSKKGMYSTSSYPVLASRTLVSHYENGPSLPSAMVSTTMRLTKLKWPGSKLTNQCSLQNLQAWAYEWIWTREEKCPLFLPIQVTAM